MVPKFRGGSIERMVVLRWRSTGSGARRPKAAERWGGGGEVREEGGGGGERRRSQSEREGGQTKKRSDTSIAHKGNPVPSEQAGSYMVRCGERAESHQTLTA